MRYTLTLCSLALSFLGCSIEKSNNNLDKEIDSLSSLQHVNDEDKFIQDKHYRDNLLAKCSSGPTFQNRSVYGRWHELTNCNFGLNGISISNTDIMIHLDDNNRVNGFRFMIFPETEYGKYLSERQSAHIVFRSSSGACSTYYWRSLPIYTYVDKSLCDVLVYGKI